VSASVLAAFAHIGGQLALARLWLVPHDGVWYLLPLFATAALVFGIINGLVAARLLSASRAAPVAASVAPKGTA
jgi:heptaprenyl diphosphate synthase